MTLTAKVVIPSSSQVQVRAPTKAFDYIVPAYYAAQQPRSRSLLTPISLLTAFAFSAAIWALIVVLVI